MTDTSTATAKPPEPETPLDYGVKSIAYACTSLFALFAGYLMRSGSIFEPATWLLVAHGALSFPFFVAYVIRFSPAAGEEPRRRYQTHVVLLFLIYCVTITILCLSLYKNSAGVLPPLKLLLPLFAHSILFPLYGFYLFFRSDVRSKMLVRHTLVWPVLLSIAINLYVGLCFRQLALSAWPLVPTSLILVFFCLSETFRFTKRQFFIGSTIGCLGAVIVSSLVPALQETLLSMLFAVAFAAYLAVFESWGLVSRISKTDATLAGHYYISTFAALIIAGLLTPAFYIFTDFTPLFLAGFTIHAAIAFVLWYRAEFSRPSLNSWLLRKNLMGFLLLGLAITDARYGLVKRPIRMFVDSSTCWILGVLTVPFLAAGVMSALDDFRRGKLYGVFKNKARYVGAVALLSLLGLWISLGFHNGSGIHRAPASHAFVVYALFVALSILALVIRRASSSSGSPLEATLAVVLMIRFFTSGVVALTVLIGNIMCGVEVGAAISRAGAYLFCMMGGFALNDYMDVERDRHNKPYRALPSGKISRDTALVVALLLLGSALALAIKTQGGVQLALVVASIIGVGAYSAVVKVCGFGKGVYTSALASIPFWSIVVSEPRSQFSVFPICVFLFIAGRELLMDILDIAGDAQTGITTLLMLLGVRKAAVLAFTCELAAAILLWRQFSPVIVVPIVLFVAVWAAIWYGTKHFRGLLVYYAAWVPMMVAIVAFCVGLRGK